MKKKDIIRKIFVFVTAATFGGLAGRLFSRSNPAFGEVAAVSEAGSAKPGEPALPADQVEVETFVEGYSIEGRRARVYLSDGSELTWEDPELERIEGDFVWISGERYRVKGLDWWRHREWQKVQRTTLYKAPADAATSAAPAALEVVEDSKPKALTDSLF